jgi:carboxylate-amine ligase
MTAEPMQPPTADELRAAFDAPEPLTLGLEEELMLLDPGTLDLLPRAAEVIDAAGDPRFKLEMPAAQLELTLPPARSVPEAIAALAVARRDLAAAAEPVGRLAAAGVHPFAAPLGELNPGPRYELTEGEYGDIARAQLVCALQVHVAVGGADRSLAVYNGLRPWLPLIAALAANAPFHAGRDTGLASIRPKIGEQLPRQGIPPAIASWDAFADALAWGAASGAVPDSRRWWWELRPHPAYGTLEIRAPDAQATVEDAAAVTALVHALTGWLAARHDAGEPLATADTWRLEENRWSAARYGMDAELADLVTGERTPARAWLAALVADLAPVADQLGCAAELATVERLAAENGAARQRAVAADGGVLAVAAHLADAYVPSGDYEPALPGTVWTP